MTQTGPPPFTDDQTRIIDSYRALRTIIAGPPPTPLGVLDIPIRSGPTITELVPDKGEVGDYIQIKGTGIIRISETGQNSPIRVFFGAVEVVDFAIEDPNVVAQVPEIEPGPVRVAVETDCGTALSNFTVESGPIVD